MEIYLGKYIKMEKLLIMKLFSIVMILILLKNLMMNFKFYYKCYKEFRKLLKKYRTLSKDLERFYKSLFSINFKENKICYLM